MLHVLCSNQFNVNGSFRFLPIRSISWNDNRKITRCSVEHKSLVTLSFQAHTPYNKLLIWRKICFIISSNELKTDKMQLKRPLATTARREYESDLRSYEHYLSSSEKKAWKKFRPVRDEPMTSAIPMQCSTNWANKPTGSWSLCWFQINPWSGE